MKKDELLEMSEKNAGYLFTSEVVEHGISKTYLAKREGRYLYSWTDTYGVRIWEYIDSV
jgi:hypothetical protein